MGKIGNFDNSVISLKYNNVIVYERSFASAEVFSVLRPKYSLRPNRASDEAFQNLNFKYSEDVFDIIKTLTKKLALNIS